MPPFLKQGDTCLVIHASLREQMSAWTGACPSRWTNNGGLQTCVSPSPKSVAYGSLGKFSDFSVLQFHYLWNRVVIIPTSQHCCEASMRSCLWSASNSARRRINVIEIFCDEWMVSVLCSGFLCLLKQWINRCWAAVSLCSESQCSAADAEIEHPSSSQVGGGGEFWAGGSCSSSQHRKKSSRNW